MVAWNRARRRRLFVLLLAIFGLLSPFNPSRASASGVISGVANEGGSLVLSAPNGATFSSIVFASYGTPLDQNGEWQNGECHAADSIEIVESIAVGTQSFSIAAINEIFGDPCPGVQKLLAVSISYSFPQPGLEYRTFSAGGSRPPEPSNSSVAISSGVISAISSNWGGGQIMNSGRNDGVIVEYQGYIRPDLPGIYNLILCSDDGMRLYLDGLLVIDDWVDRGLACGQSAEVDFPASTAKYIKVLFYENSGGAAAFLKYEDNNGQLHDVPESWYFYGSQPDPTPTTTTTTITTSTTTTTAPSFLGAPTEVSIVPTEDGVFISWLEAQNNIGVQPERYAISWSNGASGWGISTGNVGSETALNTSIFIDYSLFESTGGMDVEYTFTVRSDNDTAGVYSITSEAVLYTISTPTTTTTTATTTQAPQTTITAAEPIVVPDQPIIDRGDSGGGNETMPDSEVPKQDPEDPLDGKPTDSAPPEEQVPEPAPDGQNEEPPSETPIDAPTEPDAPEAPEEPSEPEAPEEPNEQGDPTETDANLDDATPEEAREIVAEILEGGLDSQEALSVALSPSALSILTQNQATEVFESLEVDELTDEQVAELVSAVQDAPTEVRQAFEEEINIFGGGAFDQYVPIGSVISVGERRVVVAATGVIMAGATASMASSSSSSPQTGSRGKGK